MTTPDVLIGDRYRLVRELGSGGMSVVWEAHDERLNRRVAVKQLRFEPGLSGGEAHTVAERAMREARINARLQHPNAVAIFDVVEHEDRPCLVMELVSARTLADALRASGSHTMPPSAVARLGAQVAAALAAAHGLGIVHRDIKPSNILLGADGRARISDFGISRAVGDGTLTLTGMISGTPAYLAPEVARGADPTAASDVFSLGATLYAAVEGSPPFGSDGNAIALLYRVAEGAIPTPRRAGQLTALLNRMLAGPDARPTMDQVATELTGLSSPDLDPVGADEPDASTVAIDPPTGAPGRPGGEVVRGGAGTSDEPGARPTESSTPATTLPGSVASAATPAEPSPTTAPTAAGDRAPASRRSWRGVIAATIAVLVIAVAALAVLLWQRPLGPELPSTPSASQRPTEEPAGQESQGTQADGSSGTRRSETPTANSTGDEPTPSEQPTKASASPTASAEPAPTETSQPTETPPASKTPPGKGNGNGNDNGSGNGNGKGNGNGNGSGKDKGKG